MNMAIIEPVGGHGGMNYYDFALAGGLVSAGANVTIYTCDKTEIPASPPFEVKITFTKIWGDSNKLLRAARFSCGLIKTLLDARRKQIKLVHFHFFQYSYIELLCVSLARWFGNKVVVTVHDVESFAGDGSKRLANYILSKVDKIIAHNEVSKKELLKNTKLPEGNISVIPHGNYLDTVPNRPSAAEAREKLGISSNIPVILFFGQIKKVKGLDLLLEALPSVITNFPNLKLVVAGKLWKDELSKYNRLINEPQLGKNVDLHIRYIPDDEVPTFYRAADLIVLPYRRIYQSGVLLMAMSYGVPVLVSDLDGMTEIIKQGENGFIFNSGNINDLSKQLIFSLSKPELLEKTALAGLETVKKTHDWQKIGRQTNKLYQKIVSQ